VKRTILIIMVAWFCGGCETTETQTAANVTETPAFGAQVQAPFDAMAQNAAQPETVLGSVSLSKEAPGLRSAGTGKTGLAPAENGKGLAGGPWVRGRARPGTVSAP